MRSFFKNVLANIVAIFIICASIFFFFIFIMMMSSMGEEKPSVKENSILTLDLKTQVIDSETEDQESFFTLKNKVKNAMAYNIIEAIKKAKTDDKIKGISIETDNINAGITQLDDIRLALEDFKKSGKFVYAYGNSVSQPAYYLGSVADQYFLNPAGGIELKGLSTEVVFLKDFMEKYGIGMQVIRHGKFKAAVEPYLRNEISPENKEQLSTLLNDIWSNTSSKIAASRKISAESFKTTVDSLYGIIPDLSLQHKLVDRLIQKTEYDAFLKKKLNLKNDDEINKISFNKYINSFETSTTQVGSSSFMRESASLIFSEFDSLNGRIARRYLGSGYLIKSNLFSASLEFKVFPVRTSFSFRAAPMLPASSTSALLRI